MVIYTPFTVSVEEQHLQRGAHPAYSWSIQILRWDKSLYEVSICGDMVYCNAVKAYKNKGR